MTDPTAGLPDGAVPFVKMNGLGNDFVIVDARVTPLKISNAAAQRIADRERGVGCDQLIILEATDTPGADVFMRIRNHDGGEVDACGNATRCVAWLLNRSGLAAMPVIETNAGLLSGTVHEDDTVSIDMGMPKFGWQDIPLSEQFAETRYIELNVGPRDAPSLHSPSVANVGNPHCIFWVDDLDAHDLSKVGPFLEHHPLFPERANISLAHVTSKDALTLRTWERGVGLTKACGTAACAAAVSAHRKRLTGRSVTVTLPGGPLHIAWREADDHIVMTGAIEFEEQAAIDADDFLIERL
ncbi:MAG: diaminopimelate epimerase [Pseudomonadota bacterium]